MAVTTSTIAYLLKKVYSSREVENAVYKDNPTLALLRKAGGFTGESHVHAIRHRDQLGRNVAFATAQSLGQGAAGVSKGKQFVLTRQKNYQVYTLETEAILAGRDDKGSLLRTLTTEVDSALNNIGRDMAKSIFRDGAGDIGTCVSISGAGPYVAVVGDAVTNFEVGMTIVAAASKLGALRNSGGGVVLTGVDRSAGTITMATNPDSIVANDFLFEKGDRATGAIAFADYLKIAGFEAWNPVAAPSASESFFGVDRSEDPTRLGGLRLDISTLNPEEGLVTALSVLAREGGNPSHLISSFADVKNIHLTLGSKAVMEYVSVGDVGFSSIRVTGPKGDVRVIADQNAPAAVGRLLTMGSWELKHLGDLFNMLDLDGASLSREASADRFEGRVAFYGNMLCYAPGQNMRLVMPS